MSGLRIRRHGISSGWGLVYPAALTVRPEPDAPAGVGAATRYLRAYAAPRVGPPVFRISYDASTSTSVADSPHRPCSRRPEAAAPKQVPPPGPQPPGANGVPPPRPHHRGQYR